ncbi:hypothetical protein AB0H12_30985 [Actinosynnema sp. NPDC023794]
MAGVGVEDEPRDRERVVSLVGLAGLTRVVVGAVGQGRRSSPRRPPGRGELASVRRRDGRLSECSDRVTGSPR